MLAVVILGHVSTRGAEFGPHSASFTNHKPSASAQARHSDRHQRRAFGTMAEDVLRNFRPHQPSVATVNAVPSVDRECMDILTASSSTPVTLLRVPPPGGSSVASVAFPAFIIDNLLSLQECQGLIALSERCGYEPAEVNIGGGLQVRNDSVRRTSRCMMDCPEAASVVFGRIRDVLPPHGPRDGWCRPVGLNERLRVLRYSPGDYFRPHQDGIYERPVGHPRAGDTSLMTLMIYLNTPERGGDTNFLSFAGDQPSCVAPITGRALLFDHGLLHEGATLLKGVKYAIRTDVMYTRRRD